MPRKSRLSQEQIEKLIEHFVVGTPARSCVAFTTVSRKTAIQWYHREIIMHNLEKNEVLFDGEIEVDESYFGGRRKGNRGRGSRGKTIVFGL